eukprot:6214023-Pleurochrysis_carterae.AAC.1
MLLCCSAPSWLFGADLAQICQLALSRVVLAKAGGLPRVGVHAADLCVVDQESMARKAGNSLPEGSSRAVLSVAYDGVIELSPQSRLCYKLLTSTSLSERMG